MAEAVDYSAGKSSPSADPECLRRVKIGDRGAVPWPSATSFYAFPGDVVEVPAGIAAQWLRDGICELVDDTPEAQE